MWATKPTHQSWTIIFTNLYVRVHSEFVHNAIQNISVIDIPLILTSYPMPYQYMSYENNLKIYEAYQHIIPYTQITVLMFSL